MAKTEVPRPRVAKTEVPRPRVNVLDRRLNNPFGEPATPIDLKDHTLRARWFNRAIIADKIWRAKQKGWLPVRPEDLIDPDQIGGYTRSPDGFVARGDRGDEVLMAMPKDEFDAIQMAKTKWNNRHMGNPHAMREEVVEAAGQQLGGQAAEFLGKKLGPVGGVKDQFERIERIEQD